MRFPQALGGADPLVGTLRWHADVGDDDVRSFRIDRSEQRIEVTSHGCDFELRYRLEQLPDPLADEVVVLGQHEPDRHV
jgi:hypothetical protein